MTDRERRWEIVTRKFRAKEEKQCPCLWKKCSYRREEEAAVIERTRQAEAVRLNQWPEIPHTSPCARKWSHTIAAKTSVVIGKKEKYAFNGKKLKPGTYQITSYNFRYVRDRTRTRSPERVRKHEKGNKLFRLALSGRG